VIVVILAAAQMLYLDWENGKRDRGARHWRLGREDEGRLGHRHPNFRYTL
jgi:hypothetical protein